MIAKPSSSTAAPSRIWLSQEGHNVIQWAKQSKQDCRGRFGASGTAICNDTDQLIPTRPNKGDADEDGDFIYEHEAGSTRLSDRGHKDFSAEQTRFLVEEKVRKNDDAFLPTPLN